MHRWMPNGSLNCRKESWLTICRSLRYSTGLTSPLPTPPPTRPIPSRPSRSADTTPADETADRQHLFEMLRRQGFVTGYCGTRVSLAGRRFAIQNVTVLALHDGLGNPAGHAAIIGSIGPETAP